MKKTREKRREFVYGLVGVLIMAFVIGVLLILYLYPRRPLQEEQSPETVPVTNPVGEAKTFCNHALLLYFIAMQTMESDREKGCKSLKVAFKRTETALELMKGIKDKTPEIRYDISVLNKLRSDILQALSKNTPAAETP
ncbi:MAG: hypothetical protein ACYS8W_00860 [Planctomycetota bacterium]|jgi:hypothetical protein